MDFFNKELFIADAIEMGVSRSEAAKWADKYIITKVVYDSDSDSDSESDSESDLLDLEKMTLAQLKYECAENGLSTKGTKAQLKDRLYEWDEAQESIDSGMSSSEDEDDNIVCLAKTVKAVKLDKEKPKAKGKPKPKAKAAAKPKAKAAAKPKAKAKPAPKKKCQPTS